MSGRASRAARKSAKAARPVSAKASQSVTNGRSALVLIPGSFCDERIFSRQIRLLDQVSNVHVADLPSMRNRERWLHALVSGLPERFSVAGFSLGGLFALELLRRMPERIERIALLASNAQAGTSAINKKNRKLARIWKRRGASVAMETLEPRYFHRQRVRQKHGALIHAMARRTPFKSAQAQLGWAAGRPEGYGALNAFQGPTLILSGAQDHICTRTQQRLMVATNPRSHWIELSRCGHFLMLEEPAKVGRALAAWMREPVGF